jgi:hypothetical protein
MEPEERQKECDKRKSHISSKLHMVYISSNDGHKSSGLFFSQTTGKQQ